MTLAHPHEPAASALGFHPLPLINLLVYPPLSLSCAPPPTSVFPCHHPLKAGLVWELTVRCPQERRTQISRWARHQYISSPPPTQPSFPLFYTYLGNCQSQSPPKRVHQRFISTSFIDVIAHLFLITTLTAGSHQHLLATTTGFHGIWCLFLQS